MKKKPVCLGAGLIALDVILNGSVQTPPRVSAGGSCGNVLSILAFLGWDCYPVARLADNNATRELLHDMDRWSINTDYLDINNQGSTPIIIHRILKDKSGNPVHRFEFRDPDTKQWLPSFKPITINMANDVIGQVKLPSVFYFDRMNPGTFELASYLHAQGVLTFFEPSSIKDEKLFNKFLSVTDILKFSHERIPEFRDKYPKSQVAVEIETLSKDGLAYRGMATKGQHDWKVLKGFTGPAIQDTAGAGDWCSAGIIHKVVNSKLKGLLQLKEEEIIKALNYGQLLGTLNCFYDGARGLMYHYTSPQVKKMVQNYLKTPAELQLQQLKTIPMINTTKQISLADLF